MKPSKLKIILSKRVSFLSVFSLFLMSNLAISTSDHFNLALQHYAVDTTFDNEPINPEHSSATIVLPPHADAVPVDDRFCSRCSLIIIIVNTLTLIALLVFLIVSHVS